MEIREITKHFAFDGETLDIKENRSGHINNTFVVLTEKSKYILQKINTNVFKNPVGVMNNIIYVTDFIYEKLKVTGGDSENGVLRFVRSDSGEYYYVDENGGYWRAYRYVEGNCFDACESAELFERVGLAFGNFQKQLSDFDASLLCETIPDFHNTKVRFKALEDAVNADVCGRAAKCADAIEFAYKRKDICGFIVDGIESGKFPLRVTHNDTKLNNIIMDPATGYGLCVIDLDTVMPGSLLYDFGDSIRFGASSAAEDETDLDKVFVRTELFEAYVKGFIGGTGGALTDDELGSLPDAAKIITFETGIRFLTDYLSGDTYFRTRYPEHNIDRARNQFKLVADMEQKRNELDKIIKNLSNI